ncbi:MAG: DMT family transporter [Anaerolineae bacterium]|nr:DMT family transporter [Anaerolineae bacterium]MBT7191547.1 DMT family transporter [Anaerolineae bacterium]MBT7989144.1 DMT family transporter [Anaerolineae bacterium]
MPTEKPSSLRLLIAISIAILAVSTSSVFIRFAQKEAPSLVIAASRLLLASLFLAPPTLIRHRAELKNLSRKELLLGLLSGIFLAIHFATWITSLEYTTITNSVVLVSTSPLWVAILAPIFLKEKLTKTVILGMILTLVGGTIIGFSEGCTWDGGIICASPTGFGLAEASKGNFLALAGAWAIAGYLLIGRQLRAKMSLIPYIFLVYGMAAIVMLIILFVGGETLLGYSAITYLWLLLIAIFPQLIGHSTYNWALRYLPVALVAVTTLGEPIGSSILAFVILKEIPTTLQIIGGVLILAGIYVTSQKEKRTEKKKE